jgi:HD-GYP domain-containing protein (c-di-GMP phosphodiesterase class II)
MIEDQSGQHFDPAIVAAMQARFDDFLEVIREKGQPPWEPTANMALAADGERR